jgi:hypothetical protein
MRETLRASDRARSKRRVHPAGRAFCWLYSMGFALHSDAQDRLAGATL